MAQDIHYVGPIPVKKNSYRRSSNGGMYKPQEILDFEDTVYKEILAQRPTRVIGNFTLKGSVTIKKQKDLDGAITSILDVFQMAQLIENDKLCSHIDVYKVEADSGGVEGFVLQVIQH